MPAAPRRRPVVRILHFVAGASLAALLTASCAAPRGSVLPGPAYSLVIDELEAPAETKVFAANQYPAASYPGVVMIALATLPETGGGLTVEQARQEGRRLKADFVMVTSPTPGGSSELLITAMRLTPASFGYAQLKGVVSSVSGDDGRGGAPEGGPDGGLAVGDEILAINGVSFPERIAELMRVQPGDLMTFRVRRDGQVQEVQFKALPNPPIHLELAEPLSL